MSLGEPPSPADIISVVRATLFGTAVTAANALVLTVVRWETLGGLALAARCAASLALCLFVAFKSWRVRHITVDRVSPNASRRLNVTSFLLALPWGILVAVVLPTGGEFDQLVTLIVCVGMYTGAAMMLYRTPTAMITFLVTANSGVLVGCMAAGFAEYYVLILYDIISASCVGFSAFAAGEAARERDDTLTRLSDANSELKAANKKISSFAYVDVLTGLPSRKAFGEAVERDLAEGRRYSILMFDLDNFKNINDTLGHQAGDELFSITGQRIARIIDSQSIVARLGGDEFAVLAPFDDRHEPEQLAVKLTDAVTKPVEIAGRRITPATSVGIAYLPDHATSTSELLRNADAALRRAKEQGKGRVVVYDNELGQVLDRANQVARELKKALETGDLVVHYQPKFELSSGAAAVWKHWCAGPIPNWVSWRRITSCRSPSSARRCPVCLRSSSTVLPTTSSHGAKRRWTSERSPLTFIRSI